MDANTSAQQQQQQNNAWQAQLNQGSSLYAQPYSPAVCPGCGRCHTCGRSNQYYWPYNGLPYLQGNYPGNTQQAIQSPSLGTAFLGAQTPGLGTIAK